ncbi:hypothetical protein CWB96_07970 [Pseudoalteromonas citrea]|uniref:DUF2846 domain-containing protein n=1 Tax=Pseudoalteromonas citrea TaxID=43655 RepID=A0A5S3XRQ8_9GAMM|nr:MULTISPECIES: DUF2846 domain-containing protein [Pseudoalteromonas]RJE73265.1 hypothetical protein BGP78_03110 [Pseudoalteromonas sp. MSK9-3]TMP42000.1 hypothetical protein CWB97_12885 [Pseudoalteromonas citrea]TMP59977.1 hypothetical protein CWB96_07970 [Pseudoalteromonas citrea]
MKLYIIILTLVLTITGCATTSPRCELPKASSSSNETTLVIYRPDAFYGILYSTPFSINGCRVNDLSNDSYHVYKVPAGVHKIAAEEKAYANGGDGVVSGTFEEGKVYYIHYSMAAGDFYSIAGAVGFTTTTQMGVVTKEYAYKVMPKLAEKKI